MTNIAANSSVMYAQNVFHIAVMGMFDEEESHVAKVVN